jgi:pimeloyl-ACP methyl ester carboxylesterase
MSWMSFSRRSRRDRTAPEALVVLLNDLGASAAGLASIAARWSAAVPAAAFIALDGIERLETGPGDRPRDATGRNAETRPTLLDRAAHSLEGVLEQQLRSRSLDAARLVLVGFGYGGTLGLHLMLRRSWRCAGILAMRAELFRPLPRILRIGGKVRLIDCAADVETDHGRLRDDVAALSARSIDARGVLLSGSLVSDEAIRHGGAYLVELVATAQRGDRIYPEGESRHA